MWTLADRGLSRRDLLRFGMVGAPALLGWLAASFGIRASFLIIVPVVLLAIYLARYLAPQTEAGAR